MFIMPQYDILDRADILMMIRGNLKLSEVMCGFANFVHKMCTLLQLSTK